MSLTLVTTPGSASANSFATEEEADAYLAARLNSSAWSGTDEKRRALVEATREISDLEGWIGYRVNDTQVLSWPRQCAVNPKSPFGTLFATNEIPQLVKDSTIELALEFLKAGTTDLAVPDPLENVEEETVDVLTTRYAPASQRRIGIARFPRLMIKLGPLMESVPGTVRLTR